MSANVVRGGDSSFCMAGQGKSQHLMEDFGINLKH
jgi:hypothetical protein